MVLFISDEVMHPTSGGADSHTTDISSLVPGNQGVKYHAIIVWCILYNYLAQNSDTSDEQQTVSLFLTGKSHPKLFLAMNY